MVQSTVPIVPIVNVLSSPEVMVVIFTIIGGLITSAVEFRRRRLKTASSADNNTNAAFDLANRALQQVQESSLEYKRTLSELIEKYNKLEQNYFKQIEINTKQQQLISKLNIELLFFKTQFEDSTLLLIDDEDRDPGFPTKKD